MFEREEDAPKICLENLSEAEYEAHKAAQRLQKERGRQSSRIDQRACRAISEHLDNCIACSVPSTLRRRKGMMWARLRGKL